jgi:hypothetical protein
VGLVHVEIQARLRGERFTAQSTGRGEVVPGYPLVHARVADMHLERFEGDECLAAKVAKHAVATSRFGVGFTLKNLREPIRV